jgi:APA family basic amino acid/polyamine antiporter
MSLKKVSLYTATSIVIANMVGTGVFTSLGFQAAGIHTGFAILVLWIIGGISALTGALCYAEIGGMFPSSGGEYNYLSKIYHPAVGFISGWVSATVGFAAPVAAAALALGKYVTSVYPGGNAQYMAAIVVLGITFIHATSLSWGSRFQNVFTTVKVITMAVIIICGFLAGRTGDISFRPTTDSWTDMTSTAYAYGFFFVYLAYSGWNASAYITSEIAEPKQNLPRSLFIGTAIVTVLYVAINFVFMWVTPRAQMMGPDGPVVEIAGTAANNIFGSTGGQIMSMIIAILLISTISSMILAGPRVTHTMGQDYRLLSFLGRKTPNGTPAIATLFQCAISLLIIFVFPFEDVVKFISFTLSIFTFLTVLGLFIMRFRSPQMERPFKAWGYPVVPFLFLGISVWMMWFGLMDDSPNSFYGFNKTSLIGLALSVFGLVFYFLDKAINRTSNEKV